MFFLSGTMRIISFSSILAVMAAMVQCDDVEDTVKWLVKGQEELDLRKEEQGAEPAPTDNEEENLVGGTTAEGRY